MTRFEIFALMRAHKLDPDRLQDAGDVAGFAEGIVALLAAHQQKINELEERLRRRVKRQTQKAKPPQGRPGRPTLHRSDRDYYWFWLEKQWNGGIFGKKGWLNAIQVDIDGTQLTPEKRRHIRKMLSVLTPSHIKSRRGAPDPVGDAILAGADDEGTDRWADAGPTEADRHY
jgi:hypothetical protein